MIGSISGIIGVPEIFINIFSTLIESIMLFRTIGLFGLVFLYNMLIVNLQVSDTGFNIKVVGNTIII